jgi:hypothetical protein
MEGSIEGLEADIVQPRQEEEATWQRGSQVAHSGREDCCKPGQDFSRMHKYSSRELEKSTDMG